MPLVSWLLPVKNGMPFLPETLASIAAQTERDFEVLVWDNGSTDGTLEELHRWIPVRLPGRIISGDPRGVGGALAGLVALSSAEFCARLDADDLALPDRLARQLTFLQANPGVTVVGTALATINAAGRNLETTLSYPLTHEEIVIRALTENPLGHPSVLFRRATVLAAGNYHELPNVEDYDLWLRMAAAGHQLANLPDALTRYRIHARSCTQQASRAQTLAPKMNAVFVEHAAALYGWSRETSLAFRNGQLPGAWDAANQLARHRSLPVSKPSLIDAFKSKTPGMSQKSRLRFALADRRPASLRMFVGDSFRKVLHSLPSGPYWFARVRAARALRRYDQWKSLQVKQGCQLGARLGFTGINEGYVRVLLGEKVQIENDITVWMSIESDVRPQLHIGDRSFIGQHTYIGVHEPVTIGRDVMIGAYSYIVSANHRMESRALPIHAQGFTGAPVVIGDESWLGTHVVVLPGVTIGQGAVIGAGSVVTKNVPAYEVWAGNPARFLKTRP